LRLHDEAEAAGEPAPEEDDEEEVEEEEAVEMGRQPSAEVLARRQRVKALLGELVDALIS
jgi:hypothetical protein